MLDFSALRPLTADLPPIVILSSLDSGGAGIAALRLHQGLLAAGADVKMVVIRKQSKEATVGELKINDVPLWNQADAGWVKALQDYPARPAGLELFSTVEVPFNIAGLDIVKNAGLVNLHWCAGMLPWPEAGASLRGKSLVWTLHDMNPLTGGCHYAAGCERWKQGGCGECPQLGASKSGGDLASAGFTAKRDGYAGLDLHVVTPSQWLEDCAGQSILLRAFPRTVIPNGFPLEELRSIDRTAARQALGLPQGPKIILFGADVCGNRRKGLHLLLEALPKLAAKWQGELPILATFGNASGIPDMAPGFKCFALGRIDNNAVLSSAYSAADVFVLPSTEDNLPNTIIEAQACGTPGVGFAIGGVPDIVASPSLGRLAQPYDTNDLADKIREVLLASPEEAAACRKDCREHAENTYDQYLQTAAYLKLYRERLGLPEVAPAASAVRLPRVPKGDYADPELRYVDADPFFPCKIIGDTNVSHWPWLRREIPHNWYVDCRAPSVGFLSRDEAILLHNAALPFAGENGLEIGCFMGWSACHLALAGLQLDVIDPFLDREVFRGSVTASLTAAGVIDRVNLIAGRSPGMVEQLCANGKRWKFIFIDGDHEAPGPRLDAVACEECAPEGALVMFHDVAAPAVAEGVRYFRDKGWNVRLYHTTQIMAAAWRGEVPVPRHAPDPRVAWTIPGHLADLAPLFETLATGDAAPLASAIPAAQAAPATPDADAETFQRGQRLMEAGNYAEALKAFSALKGRRAPLANLDLCRGYCFLQMNQLISGRQALLEELRFFPDNQNAKGLLAQIQTQIRANQEREMAALQVNDEFRELFAHVNDFTMVGVPRLWSLYRLTRQVCEADVPGNFVECGVAGGGTSALIATVLHRYSRRPRQLFSFDTFSGMPTPTAEDFMAHNKQGADDSHWGTGTCAAPEDSLRKIATELGVLGHIVITKGLFADTLPTRKADIGEIAFLHMDGDWYQSTKDIIDNLYEQLRPGGAVQVDDFGAWAGCRKALEEYFSRIGFAPEATKIDGTGVSFPVTEALTRAVHAAIASAATTATPPAAAGVKPTVANAAAVNDATHDENDDGFAPIVLFAYNRRDLVEKTVDALKANPEAAQSDLYVFADGAKPGQEENVNAVREYLRSVSGFRSVHLTCRESNLGLAPNVIDGVTAVVNAHGRVIVMEDDLVTSPHYLRYMNEALKMYANTPEVVCISGYAFPVEGKMPNSYFIRGTCCWGWATWKRGWELFNPNSEALYNTIVARNATYDFDFDGCYPYTGALKRNNKLLWAVRWMASAYVQNKLCLFPGRSLVNNIGFGGDASNCRGVSGGDPYQTEVAREPIPLRKIAPVENPEHRRAIGKFLRWSAIVLEYAYKYERMPGSQALQAMMGFLDRNGYDIAAFVLDKLIERGDGNLENVYALRGFSRWQLGDRAGGEADIREELRRHPNNPVALDLLRQIEANV